MDKLSHEYIKYGPWMMEVKEPLDIPPQFESYQDQILAASYCFKVPIHGTRRDLKPGMLLYDQLVILEQSTLTLLSMDKGELRIQKVDYSDIDYIAHSGDLLLCHIQLFYGQSQISINYSLVSIDIAAKAVHIIREAMKSTGKPFSLPEQLPPKQSKKQIYEYFLQREAIKEPVSILGFQASRTLDDAPIKGFHQFLARILKYKMQDVLFMTDAYDLIISNWGTDIIREKDTDYHVEHLFIAWPKISAISLQPHPHYPYLKSLQIETTFKTFSFSVEEDFSAVPLLEYFETEIAAAHA
ncbi:hypothetical protein ACVFI8_19030 [Agarivorans sp. MS3-6]